MFLYVYYLQNYFISKIEENYITKSCYFLLMNFLNKYISCHINIISFILFSKYLEKSFNKNDKLVARDNVTYTSRYVNC